MIHGDALITQKLQQPAPEDLLSEVQGSLDQLFAFSKSLKGVDESLQANTQAMQSHTTDIAPDSRAQTAAAPSLELSAVRRHSRAAATAQQRQQRHSHDGSAHGTTSMPSSSSSEMFQTPNLPGMPQTEATRPQSTSADDAALAGVWAGMQPELLSQVLHQVAWTSKEAMALTGVCR